MQITNIEEFIEAAKTDSLRYNDRDSMYNRNDDLYKYLNSAGFINYLETILKEISQGSYSRELESGNYLVEFEGGKEIFYYTSSICLWYGKAITASINPNRFKIIKKLNPEEL